MAWLSENASRPSLNTRRRSIEISEGAERVSQQRVGHFRGDGQGKWDYGGGLGRGGVLVAGRWRCFRWARVSLANRHDATSTYGGRKAQAQNSKVSTVAETHGGSGNQ